MSFIFGIVINIGLVVFFSIKNKYNKDGFDYFSKNES